MTQKLYNRKFRNFKGKSEKKEEKYQMLKIKTNQKISNFWNFRFKKLWNNCSRLKKQMSKKTPTFYKIAKIWLLLK